MPKEIWFLMCIDAIFSSLRAGSRNLDPGFGTASNNFPRTARIGFQYYSTRCLQFVLTSMSPPFALTANDLGIVAYLTFQICVIEKKGA
jgi:hypothetical protein